VKQFMLGVVVALVGVAAGAYVYFAKGFAPVATSARAMPFEKRLARLALHARMDKEMPRTVPIEAGETHYLSGAHTYVEHCAVCHGLPGKPESAIARGEFPRPPQLFEGKGVTDDPPGETYWKTTNGIRLTGMPGFAKSLSETQIWEVALLLANADRLPGSVTAVLKGQSEPAGAPMGSVAAPPPTAK
jgi:mono/diheme cytochrome c family protein